MNLSAQSKKKISALVAKHASAAYLFGSFATGQANSNSDIDIALLMPSNISSKKRFALRLRLITELEGILNRRCDLVILNDTPSLELKYSIISKGELLFSKNEVLRAKFEAKAMAEYFDFKPFIDLYNKYYVARSA